MDVGALLLELYGRIPPLAREAVDGLTLPVLATSIPPGANPIAWLVWHTARVQDHHVSELRHEEQLWVTGDWARQFELAPDPSNIGYGHTPQQVSAVRPQRPEVLLEYLEAAYARSSTFLQSLTPADLDEIVDRRWDPPVTLGVRLVSIADDALQHMGQAAYARGILGG
jgi:hypothetical protein